MMSWSSILSKKETELFNKAKKHQKEYPDYYEDYYECYKQNEEKRK